MKFVDSLGQLSSTLRHPKSVSDADSLDYQDFVVQLDVTLDFRAQITLGQLEATRFQRASKGPCQSPASRGDDIVESGCVWWKSLGVHSIVFGDLRMDAEVDGVLRRLEGTG